jgi:hypothetical protein
MNDPVERFLNSHHAGPPLAELREAVLSKTTRILRRRLLRRRLAWAGALAACFLAGMATMFVWRSFKTSQQPEPSPLAKADPLQKPDPATTREPPSLVDLEWLAFDSRDDRADLFFEVARLYFEEQHDFDSAVRCYSQALDAAPREVLAIRPDDNRLVMALKEARQKGEQ